MSLTREQMKTAAVALLDAVATEHPLGHQPSKASRYVLCADGGVPIEIMFEKNESSPANLWVHLRAAGPLAVKGRSSPASSLRTKIGTGGITPYGRHSALEKMPQLGEADLVCFSLGNLAELGAVLDQLLAASAARIRI
jgi:hypothetical protein